MDYGAAPRVEELFHKKGSPTGGCPDGEEGDENGRRGHSGADSPEGRRGLEGSLEGVREGVDLVPAGKTPGPAYAAKTHSLQRQGEIGLVGKGYQVLSAGRGRVREDCWGVP